MYIWQHPQWPHFEYNLSEETQDLLYQYAMESKALLGEVDQLPQDMQMEAIIDLMVAEAMHTSGIEGEHFKPEDIRSSIKRALGISTNPRMVSDQKAIGISQLMITVRNALNTPLSRTQLFEWNSLILSNTSLYQPDIEIGKWRNGTEPMLIVSGAIGHEKIHYEAPPSANVEKEMQSFIDWFNESSPLNPLIQKKISGPVRAAIAHLYFESIHPFADGNGRIGRAIVEKALSEELKRPLLFSLSTTIHREKNEYYQQLAQASRYTVDITPWIHYFVKTVHAAQLNSKQQIIFVLQKARFWSKYQNILNKRQEKAIATLFKNGVFGFEGGLNARKYKSIAGCSKATATRDLSELLEQGCLVKLPGSGRNTRYDIALPPIAGI